MKRLTVSLSVIWLTWTGPAWTDAAAASGPGSPTTAASQPWGPFSKQGATDLQAVLKLARKAPPLPEPTGKVVGVSDAAGLRRAVASAKPGTTILLADGRYRIDRLRIGQDRLSLRGASGDRDKVILDGGGKLTRIVIVESGKDLLFADLTVANSTEYGIFFYGDDGAHRLRVYNVKFHNCLTRGLKGTYADKVLDSWTRKHPPEKEKQLRPIGGQVRHCLFVNGRASPRLKLYSGDYIGGIDIMSAKDWTVADNVFVDIRGQRGGGRGAIFFWVKGENVTVERNLIINCDRGICFGNPSGKPWHMTGGIIRNNFIVAGRSEAIEVSQARNTLVANNTLWCRQQKQRAVRLVGPVPGCRLVNNLIRGSVAAPAESKREGNIVGELKGWSKRPQVGDLHLTAKAAGAVGKGVALKEVTTDFDRQQRKSPPEVGADEINAEQGDTKGRADGRARGK